MFKVGDRVRLCNDRGFGFIANGYVSEVLAVSSCGNCIYIECPDGCCTWFYGTRFEKFEEDKTNVENKKVEADVLNLYKIVGDEKLYAEDNYFATEEAMIEWLKRHARVSSDDFGCSQGVVYVDGVKYFRYEEVKVVVYK